MNISITGHHVELTDALKAHVEEKLQHLKTAFDELIDAHVVLSVEKLNHVCEVTIHTRGETLHAKASEQDLYAAIDVVIDKLNRQLAKHQARRKPHLRHDVLRKARQMKSGEA